MESDLSECICAPSKSLPSDMSLKHVLAMTKLQLSFAIGNYDRTRALIDGTVAIDGVDPVYMTLVPEEIFFRAFRSAEFDICELSLSSYAIQTARNERPYIA